MIYSAEEKARREKVVGVLRSAYQGSRSALSFASIFQLLVAVILSAQTNDNQVNAITAPLFAKFPAAADFAALSEPELEGYIKTCGLYKNKAKNIIASSRLICEKFEGEVPRNRQDLMSLPGVGRKSANVVLSVGYGLPALAVDTHVFRVSRRLGLASAADAEGVEEELCAFLPQELWGDAHHWLIWHGRKVCRARNPHCSLCPVKDCCPSACTAACPGV